jgi:hypothetical protein
MPCIVKRFLSAICDRMSQRRLGAPRVREANSGDYGPLTFRSQNSLSKRGVM